MGKNSINRKRKARTKKKRSPFLLEVRNITKIFPGVIALNKVNLEIIKGEVHAVVGENGAGKSTLCNILTGIYQPEEGELFWNGKKIRFYHPRQALDAGIRMVYQERNLIPFLTGAQNICLGEEETKRGLLDEEKILHTADALRKHLGTDVPIDIPVRQLPPPARQMIEISRAFRREPELLLLDEPTASLAEDDVKALFNVIDKIRKEGISIVFISHKLGEVFQISDRISIFRNGEKVYTGKTSEVNREMCIKYMINRELKRRYPKVVPSAKEKLLEIQELGENDRVKNITLHIRKGEVVGFYGLVGSGRTELAELLYGLRKEKTGKIIFDGKELGTRSPAESIREGFLLVPEDRKEHGLFYSFNLKQNISISFLKQKLIRFISLIRLKDETKLAQEIADSAWLRLQYKDINQGIDELSGGNKQKVVIARWIAQEHIKLLIMDEPTQGIDVGTKYEIYVLLRHLAEEGIGIIFISSELPELLGVCDRLYIFRGGTIVGELNRPQFSEKQVLRYALG